MSRSASESSLFVVPDCGMHVPPPLHAGVNAATERLVGPVIVVFAGVVQSTWNFQSCNWLVPKLSMKFGSPVGGAVGPSRSEGRTDPYVLLSVKHCWVAAWPASIF